MIIKVILLSMPAVDKTAFIDFTALAVDYAHMNDVEPGFIEL